MNEHIHLAKTGRLAQDIVGPISIPSVGPTFPMELKHIVIAFVLSIPAEIMTKAIRKNNKRYAVRNASSDTRCGLGILTPLIFKGSTALGCKRCKSSFLIILKSITPLTHFRPPLVLPEQAPINIHSASTTQVTCGHNAALSLKRPVVVMKLTT